ncbi:hypothetical protein Tco_1128107 [Tanacetum coccineum]
MASKGGDKETWWPRVVMEVLGCLLGDVVMKVCLLDAVRITVARVFVNAAQLDLVLLMNFKENMLSVYYC